MFISDDRLSIMLDKMEGYLSGYLVIEKDIVFIQTPTSEGRWSRIPVKDTILEILNFGAWEKISLGECKTEAIDDGYLYAGLRARVKQEED